MKTTRWILGSLVLLGGLGLLGRAASIGPVTSSAEALAKLERQILPKIALDPAPAPLDWGPVSAVLPAAEALPSVAAYPLYGAPVAPRDRAGRLRVEIVSSLEKADGASADRRWLVDVAERFNQRGNGLGTNGWRWWCGPSPPAWQPKC